MLGINLIDVEIFFVWAATIWPVFSIPTPMPAAWRGKKKTRPRYLRKGTDCKDFSHSAGTVSAAVPRAETAHKQVHINAYTEAQIHSAARPEQN